MSARLPRHAGFSLVELTLALGVASFSLLAILGLLPVSLLSNQASIEQTAANGILSAVVADLRSTPLTVPHGQQSVSEQFGIAIPASSATTSSSSTLYFDHGGQLMKTLGSGVRDRLTVTYPVDGASSATQINLQVSWPAAAAPGVAAGSVQTFVALSRN